LFGFFISLSSYYVIAKYISPPLSSMVNEAVLPPQKGDISPPSEEDSSIDTKRGVTAHTKEVDMV
jgi:hypothetical protein